LTSPPLASKILAGEDVKEEEEVEVKKNKKNNREYSRKKSR